MIARVSLVFGETVARLSAEAKKLEQVARQRNVQVAQVTVMREREEIVE